MALSSGPRILCRPARASSQETHRGMGGRSTGAHHAVVGLADDWASCRIKKARGRIGCLVAYLTALCCTSNQQPRVSLV